MREIGSVVLIFVGLDIVNNDPNIIRNILYMYLYIKTHNLHEWES